MTKHTLKRLAATMIAMAIGALPACAAGPLGARSAPPDPHFNRLYPNTEIIEFLKGYASAYPDWVTLESVGKSIEGHNMWLLTINNPKTGEASSKPGMYVDGAIHANEAQGTETVLYTIDYMLKNYGKLDRVTELMDRAAFYFFPMVNPDSRAKWFSEPSTPHFPRTVQVHVDDDRDGRTDEDGYDDLNGDGFITQMRKKVPLGEGSMRLDPKDPRLLVPLEDGELGDYIQLGYEGVDNDGDGSVNEDSIGYVDPNRTWGYYWQPRYVQSGASQYPLQIPESRSIAMWAMDHQNIAAVQSFHNSGRMILRGPGAKSEPPFPGADVRVYDYLGHEAAKLLPGYRYMIIWKDLYTVYGGTVNHFYGVHGDISFTDELNGPEQDFDGDGEVSEQEKMKFNDMLTQGRMFIPWQTFDHPQYGEIEIGGYRYDTGRAPEGWMLEEDCHRNASFVLFHARNLPKLSFKEPTIERAGDNLWRVMAPIVNERAIPSMTAWARSKKLHRPDIATVSGARVISSGVVRNKYMSRVQLQEHRPERLEVQGVDGLSTRTLFFLVEGSGEITIRYDSLKGGVITESLTLE